MASTMQYVLWSHKSHIGWRQNRLYQVSAKRCSGKMDYTIRQRKPTRIQDDLGRIRGRFEETVRGCRRGKYSKNKDRKHDSGSQDLYGLLKRIQASGNGGQL